MYDRVKEVKLELNVRFTLKNQHGKIIWEEPGVLYKESFFVDETDAAGTRDNKEEALTRLVENLSERIYLGLLDAITAS